MRNWDLLTVLWISAILLHYGLSVLILSLNLVFIIELILRTERRILLIKWAITQILGMGAVVVVYQLSLKHLDMSGGRGGAGYLAYAYWDGSFISLAKLAINNTHELFYFAYPEFLFLFIVCVGFLFILDKVRHTRTVLLMFTVPMVCTFTLACAKFYPYCGERQDMFLTPMLYILAGYGFSYLSSVNKNHIVLVPLVFILGSGRLNVSWRRKYQTYCKDTFLFISIRRQNIRSSCRTFCLQVLLSRP